MEAQLPKRYDKKQTRKRLGRRPKDVKTPPDWVDVAAYDKLCCNNGQWWVEELSTREGKMARPEFAKNWKSTHPDFDKFQLVNSPAEADAFLVRPSSTIELWNAEASKDRHPAEDAAHAVKCGFAVFGFDPSLPDDQVSAQFCEFLSRVRRNRPITVRRTGPGRPSGPVRISSAHLARWREHRILLLFDLLIADHNPATERKTIAAWMFPEIEDEIARGNKCDEARRLLDEARENARSLWAQERGKPECETD